MKVGRALRQIVQQEDVNFLLTNRIPRHLATRFAGWFSKIEQPFVRDLTIAVWRLFGDLDLADAERTKFKSVHDCFIRRLRPEARPVDSNANVVVSPCDAIVGASGRIAGTTLFQAKGFPYTLEDLLHDDALVQTYRDGLYVTLRLTAGMYHRFHAPYDCRIVRTTYVSGDTWNVNPIALRRIERLFCKNERVVIETALMPGGMPLALVPVAAILVASIRLHWLDVVLNVRHAGAHRFESDVVYRKGDELGWFEHGSTILLFAPRGAAFHDNVREGERIRMGQALLLCPNAPAGGTARDHPGAARTEAL